MARLEQIPTGRTGKPLSHCDEPKSLVEPLTERTVLKAWARTRLPG